ncbi:GNAT family N-acetyltransferase [Microbulbifer sp. MLAF003]|uniref:GNAT family N-acetyltransferase n=1 Tax=unclassified Microbulbifer TaxID=2619833 RepID=UPI0024AD3C60|nr:GNAT family N-acetyltransferase [Microbulbifer sp. MLAF003]WHI51240.1 GNAT family N-acetyltransferase [Microbulbifer sp. MLAF003]
MIRKAELKELDRLEQLWLHATANSHPSLSRQFWLDHVAQFRRDCRQASLCLVFTGRHNAVAEAFITLLDRDRIAYLCVSPIFSGCGIGASLLSAAGKGRLQLQTEVLRENLRTRYFLQKQGFVETGRRYIAEYGQHLIQMRFDRTLD